MKAVAGAIQNLGLQDLLQLEKGQRIEVAGEQISLADVEIRRQPRGINPDLSTHQLVSIEIDPTVGPEQIREGLAREVTRKIQAARKSADFVLDDRIRVEIHCEGALRDSVETHQSTIQEETLCKELRFSKEPTGTYTETVEIDGDTLKLGLTVVSRL